MSNAEQLAARIAGIALDPDPWPHATLDDFLPADVYAELLDALPAMNLVTPAGRSKKDKGLPRCVVDLLHDPLLLDAIRQRFGFRGGKVMLEAAWFGRIGLAAHVDRADKLWNGQVYLTGDPKGTELYDATGKLARSLEWAPNRFTCWPPPGAGLKHAAPQSEGRFVLLWWILDDTPRTRQQRKAWAREQREKEREARRGYGAA